jgi:hypothetical protein
MLQRLFPGVLVERLAKRFSKVAPSKPGLYLRAISAGPKKPATAPCEEYVQRPVLIAGAASRARAIDHKSQVWSQRGRGFDRRLRARRYQSARPRCSHPIERAQRITRRACAALQRIKISSETRVTGVHPSADRRPACARLDPPPKGSRLSLHAYPRATLSRRFRLWPQSVCEPCVPHAHRCGCRLRPAETTLRSDRLRKRACNASAIVPVPLPLVPRAG